ncbi:hypothetical protein GBAR_LOCUS7121 [Geodia barretti]|uniref:Uncharacterized protein n=1 Tax=Geodia barretti TaxID=519541 RepID=A0AA35RG82_GEOBA|nr:hypothetical protein GBAR_LOCUS7121 [Geodia barretti]
MSSEAVAVEKTRRLSHCPHWSYCLPVGIIVSVSLAIPLVLLPYFLRDEYSLTVFPGLALSMSV